MTEYPIPGPKVCTYMSAAKRNGTRLHALVLLRSGYGPGTAEEIGFKDGKTVGRIGVDPPNGWADITVTGDFTTDSLTTDCLDAKQD